MKTTKLAALTAMFAIFIMQPINTPAQNSRNISFEPHEFESSKKDKVQAEMGTLIVPENRAKKNGRTIKLKFVRFKSTSKNPGSPIVYLAGGPGGSGILSAKYSRFQLFMAMREVGDVIALDQRGTGMSEPNLACKETLSYPAEKEPSLSELTRIYTEQSRLCAKSFNEAGIDLSAYNTNSSADDIEDLRKALGAEKLSLWGISYGTHLSLATIRRHEKSIDRVILAGVEGPDHTLKLPENVDKYFALLDRLAKNDPRINAKIPSFLALIKKVMNDVDENPRVVEVTNPVTKKKVKVTVNKFLLQILTWSALGSNDQMLPAVFRGLAKGDYEPAAIRWLSIVTSNRRIGLALSFMKDCHSGASRERRERIKKSAKESLLGNVINFPFPEVCEGWGNPDLGDSFREPVKTNVPTLFISGTLDVRTPPSNAEEVREGIPNSTHLIIKGARHSDPLFLSSPKIRETMLKFMKGDKLPGEINIEMTKPFEFESLP